METHRSIALGFSLSTAALLATPVLNLVFRPIIIAGSSHLLGQLEKAGHDAPRAAETPDFSSRDVSNCSAAFGGRSS